MDSRNNYFIIPNFETCPTPNRKRKKKNNNTNKRRFSDEQIRSLETIFHSMEDSKLDPKKKVQLATELGLQPRQIGIWFQNRRARWKSKEMENNFKSLKANYDNLASQFKTLQEENNSLLAQLQKLSMLLREPRDNYETREKPKTLQEELDVTYLKNNHHNTYNKGIVNGEGHRGPQMTHLSEGRSSNITHVEEKACQLWNPNEWFELSETWCNFDSYGGGILDY